MPGTLADEISRAESSLLSSVSASSPSHRSSEVRPGLSYSQAVSQKESPEPSVSGDQTPNVSSFDYSQYIGRNPSQMEETSMTEDVPEGVDLSTQQEEAKAPEEGPWILVSYKRERG